MHLRRDTVGLAALLILIGVFSITPARAHHSFAPYETTVQIKLTGTVTELKWANPHVYFEIDATDAKTGAAKHWLIECASTSILNRAGWRFNIIKPGDKVTVVVNPVRSGEPAGIFRSLTLADGRVLTERPARLGTADSK